MLRVDVQYLDEPSHSVRLTLAEKHRRTRACGVLVKSFLKSFREKHGAGLDDAAPRLALRRARDGAILERDALIGDALEDGDVVVLEPSSARPEEPPPPSSLRCVLRARADAEIRALELVARAPPSGKKTIAVKGKAVAADYRAADPRLEIRHEPRVGNRLAARYLARGAPATYDAARPRVALIVETRPTPWLVLAIRNAVDVLADDGGGDDGRVRGWNLCVAGDAATLAYVRARVDGAFLTMELPGPLADNAAFSALLLERDVSGRRLLFLARKTPIPRSGRRFGPTSTC